MLGSKYFKVSDYLVTLSCLLVVSIASITFHYAQVADGTISGTVQDPTGGLIPGVEISLIHTATGATRTVITSDDGRYMATGLPIGSYEISVEFPGFKKFVRQGIRLSVGDHLVVDITLEVGEMTETVTVVGGASLIQSETSAVSQLIEGEQITGR